MNKDTILQVIVELGSRIRKLMEQDEDILSASVSKSYDSPEIHIFDNERFLELGGEAVELSGKVDDDFVFIAKTDCAVYTTVFTQDDIERYGIKVPEKGEKE